MGKIDCLIIRHDPVIFCSTFSFTLGFYQLSECDQIPTIAFTNITVRVPGVTWYILVYFVLIVVALYYAVLYYVCRLFRFVWCRCSLFNISTGHFILGSENCCGNVNCSTCVFSVKKLHFYTTTA